MTLALLYGLCLCLITCAWPWLAIWTLPLPDFLCMTPACYMDFASAWLPVHDPGLLYRLCSCLITSLWPQLTSQTGSCFWPSCVWPSAGCPLLSSEARSIPSTAGSSCAPPQPGSPHKVTLFWTHPDPAGNPCYFRLYTFCGTFRGIPHLAARGAPLCIFALAQVHDSRQPDPRGEHMEWTKTAYRAPAKRWARDPEGTQALGVRTTTHGTRSVPKEGAQMRHQATREHTGRGRQRISPCHQEPWWSINRVIQIYTRKRDKRNRILW